MPSVILERPSLGRSSSSSSANSHPVIEDYDYPAVNFPDYTEKPLSEQLEPIAVVGMGCRLPGDVNSPAEFWELMINKRSAQTPKVPASRFNIDAHLHPNNERPGSFNVPGGYFLDGDLQDFDPALFNISPVEAMWMDPQQRKLLEVVYEAFESGGVTLKDVENTTTACFIGSFTSDFQQMSFKEPDFRHSYAATGVDPGIISNRISHVFNLHGPSITVNTACSSSVYAMHNACNALRNNECSAAVVGGSNLILTVDQHENTAKLGVLSPNSTCSTFNEHADGYGRAEAVGAVYLKRLSDAIRDGNPIRGVLRTSAVNSNGRAPAVGITYPGLQGQEDVIRHAYRRGGDLDPRLTGYFEIHGTGTPIGDPLEVQATSRAMNDSPRTEPLLIGAVKTNIGHSEAASGISAVIKAVLAVENNMIPPTHGVTRLNSKIAWDDWKVKVVTEPTPFPAHLPVRRVSVNSFGYGGTNGHVMVESVESFLPGYKLASPKIKLRGAQNVNRPYLLPFSAHDKPTLKRNITAHSKIANDYNLLDLTYTLANRRSRHPSRAFAVASSASLDSVFENDNAAFSFAEKKKCPTIGFAFTGQGAQWARMGSELMTYYPSFLRTIRKLDQALGELTDGPNWTLEDTLLEPAATSRVNEAEFSQPLCTAIQVAVVELLESWDIRPKVTVGHSSGEIGAAFAAGLISASEAIIVAYYRGKVVRSVNTNGSMMAVGLGAEGVAPFLESYNGQVVIACHNSPSSVTLSGDADALEKIKVALDAESIFARAVKTGGKAYHSHHMKAVATEYETLVQQAKALSPFDSPRHSDAVMVSSVTNSKVTPDQIIDEYYWSANLTSPVLFNQAVQTIVAEKELSVDLLIEIGPHSALSGPIKQICTKFGFENLGYIPSLVRNADSAAQLLKVAGELFLRDYPLNMERVTAIEQSLPSGKLELQKGSILVNLPTYQWNYAKKLWAEPRQSVEHRAPTHARHDVLGGKLPGGSKTEPIWRNMLRIRDVPWLKHHSLGGEAVFPAAGYFSMAIEAITQINEDSESPVKIDGYVLRDISIKAALVTPDNDTGIETLFSMRPSIYNEGDDSIVWWDFNVSSVSEEGEWRDHMTGTISANTKRRGQTPKAIPNLPQRASGKSWNQGLKDVGFDYGATFQDMDDVRSDGKNYIASAKTVIKQECGIIQGESRYALHPGTVDSCLQLIIVSIYAGRLNAMKCGAVPIQVDSVEIWNPSSEQISTADAQAYSWTDQRGIRSFVSGSQLVASNGELLMNISDMRCVAYEAAVPQRAEEAAKPQPFEEMVWKYDIDSLKSSSSLASLNVSDIVELIAHKNPSSKTLEIGSQAAASVLSKNKSLYYTIAESSDEARHLLEGTLGASKYVSFLKLDIAAIPEDEENVNGTYDLILATGLKQIHAQIILNIKSLLAPEGRVIFKKTAGITEDSLKAAGFSSIDVSTDFVISTVANDSNSSVKGTNSRINLVYRSQPAPIIAELKTALEKQGFPTTTSKLNSRTTKSGESVILLADLEGPLLATLQETELSDIQHLTTTASSILWVSCGGLLNGKIPEYAMAAGLGRSVRSEQASLDFTTLDFDLENTAPADVRDIIVASASRQLLKTKSREAEYYVSNGLVYISRLLANTVLNDAFVLNENDATPTPYNPEEKLGGKVQSGKVVFQADERFAEPLKGNEVELKVIYSAITKEGTLVVNGTDYPTTFSHEVAGVITKTGSEVKNLVVGDHVFGFSFSNFATIQRTSADLLQRVEKGDSLEELATIPMAYASALYGLKNLAQVTSDDTVLIMNGTGSAGIAAIKFSQLMGSKVFVVAESEDEATKLSADYKLPKEQILLTSDFSLLTKLGKLAGGHGIDVIFSCAYSDATLAREAWRTLIAPFGRFIDFGRKNVLKRSALDTLPLHQGANYLSFDVLDLYTHRPQILADLLRLMTALYRQKSISSGPFTIKPLTEIDSAFSSYSDSFSAGTPLVSYKPTEGVLNVLPTRPTLQFRPDATYLLVGCLGGLGRSLTSWMMEKGAKRFAFLSRSGTDSEQAAILIRDIEAAGVSCQVIRGDATIKADVERAVKGVPSEFPIRGVVQAAMVLKDGLFHSMSYSNWVTSTQPKVLGTLNLHNVLAKTPLDFFVMTSSTSGILGTPGQANYAAANSFLDSLARHRVSSGHRAASLVLPMVLGVGYVAEHPEIEEALKRKGIYGIDEDHLLESFEAAMVTQTSKTPVDHVVVGLDPVKLQKSVSGSETTDGFWLEDARFKTTLHEMKASDSSAASGGSDASIMKDMKNAASAADAVQAVSDYFVEKLSRLLLVDLDEFEPSVKSIASYGLDSMIGAELRNWIFKELGLDIPFQQLLGPTLTITKFAIEVCANQGIVLEESA